MENEKQKYYRCISIGDGSYKVEELYLRNRWKNCFLIKDDAIADYKNAEIKAMEKYEKIIAGIRKLKEEVGDFDYDCEVTINDDYGLETQMNITFEVDGYNFKFNQEE